MKSGGPKSCAVGLEYGPKEGGGDGSADGSADRWMLGSSLGAARLSCEVTTLGRQRRDARGTWPFRTEYSNAGYLALASRKRKAW